KSTFIKDQNKDQMGMGSFHIKYNTNDIIKGDGMDMTDSTTIHNNPLIPLIPISNTHNITKHFQFNANSQYHQSQQSQEQSQITTAAFPQKHLQPFAITPRSGIDSINTYT